KGFLEDDDARSDDSIFIVDPGWDDYCVQASKLNRPVPLCPDARRALLVFELWYKIKISGITKFSSMFFKVDFAKAYDSVCWDYLLDVLEAFGFGHTWHQWIWGTLSSVRASVLINGSPSKEFSCHRGLKQGDPLAPYLFILIMESLHLSFSNAVEEGLFKGIQLSGSTFISHLFYADDVMFLGEWSEGNLKGILNILKSFFLASGLQINVNKSQLLGMGVTGLAVEQVAASVGCTVMNPQFWYLGVTERITGKKITWVAWNKVLAAKKHGGLGVSSYFAFNRVLLLKWVWRFISNDGSLWCQTIRALYGQSIDSHPNKWSSNWCSILRGVDHLKEQGFDFRSHCKKRIGNASLSLLSAFFATSPSCDSPSEERSSWSSS
nr:RNA-directed DNA polymerase, eukaryota, reverse transcriptase zinc-binding domain protein [Tanacetum cinerariifolium]